MRLQRACQKHFGHRIPIEDIEFIARQRERERQREEEREERRRITAWKAMPAAEKRAEESGYYLGRNDVHYSLRTYATGAEYIAWLKGWRRGQVEWKARLLW